MRIGFGQVSIRDQNPDGQSDELAAASCDRFLVDKANVKLARRLDLDEALLLARAGDQLVVTKPAGVVTSAPAIALAKEL